ncbi:hypothetical protein [Mycobacterium sp. M26]|uniref:hypothetical protein n=1 Tax=Mycobacterium sp. M26 TaxID=1762962 RepID=UPI00073F8E33|nr:hypothetical protein [Mycobacterium sp. M26]
MSTAVSSVFKTGIALAGAGAIAMSPLVPTHDVRVPTVDLPSVELSALATPAIGAIPYQIGVNTLGNLLALAPILAGSTEQCTVCLGPVGAGLPFTGWGLAGIGAGLIASPIAFVQTLQGDGSVSKALGAALLAIQTPMTNTFRLLVSPREVGGYALQAALDRAFNASKHIIDYTVNILAQALVTGPLTVTAGAVTGSQIFAGTLASTGDFITAFNAGRAPFEAAVNKALTDLTSEVDEGRATVYADLTAGPGQATSPIPVVSTPPTAAVAGPVTKKTTSFKAVPTTTAAAAAATGDDNGSGATDSDAGSSSGKAGKSTGGSKRQHKAD